MKKFILIIVIIAFFIYPSICLSSYLIELKNGSAFITNHYWKEGRQIKFYYRGGIVGISKDLVRKIRESDLPYKEEVVEKKAPQTPEITSKEDEKKAGEETKTKSKDIDVAYYKREKRALMEKYRGAREKLKQAREDHDIIAKKDAKKEIRKLDNQISELAIKLKEENNGILPAWWYMESKPEQT